ncbi:MULTISPECIES: site-specific DNA-methyltransferase [Emticicia]|uniref:site-specific DNA-methyltransferase n=1 Tax=Emticicia TaxID=312278 RepID=UPI0007D8A3C6|nr:MULTISPECIES: site-specific DNA-methyltransferase [Emticicia]
MTDKLDLTSPDLVQQNIERISALFPNCITETANGKQIDFDLLRQELSHDIVEGNKERYRLEWPGKREAIVTANLPTTNTLRPVVEDSVNFDSTENLYIEGDNLEVLKLLQESYLGKIKMIYIDPPYNTGNDFVYKDNFTQNTEEYKAESGLVDEYNQRMVANPDTSGRYHSDWLTMMYPRLKLARNLLTDDGLIFISIDENECHNLKKLCDEIFGDNNFLTEIIWKNKTGGGAKSIGWIGLHEYILCYSKNTYSIADISIPYSEKTASMYNKKDEKYAIRGPYATWPLDTTSMGDRPNLKFPIIHEGVEIWPEKQWLWSQDRVEEAQKNNILVFNKQSDGTYKVRFKGYLKGEDGIIRRGTPLSIFDGPYSQDGSKDFQELFPKSIFPFPKPIKLLSQIFTIRVNNTTPNGDIILDFFGGSSSTAHAIFKQNAEDRENRKFIIVQLPEATDEKSEAYKAGYKNICEIGKERIRRAGKKIVDEQATQQAKKAQELDFEPNATEAKLDVGFRVYRLDSSNMQEVYYRPKDYDQASLDLFADNIKPDRTAQDLVAQIMLDWGLPLSLPIERVSILGKEIFKIAGNALFACFDKGIDENFARAIATEKPLRVVFRDASFANDTAKENVKQLLKQLSTDTEMRVI